MGVVLFSLHLSLPFLRLPRRLGAPWRWGRKRKESLQPRLWNRNICIKRVDAKCWLAEMTKVMMSLPLALAFTCFSIFFTFAFISTLPWLAEIWQLSQWEATGEQRRSCKLSFLFPPSHLGAQKVSTGLLELESLTMGVCFSQSSKRTSQSKSLPNWGKWANTHAGNNRDLTIHRFCVRVRVNLPYT